MIAISAMILPGLSGAFILLIFGKYEFITSALKNPLIIENLKIILLFCSILFRIEQFLKQVLHYQESVYNQIILSLIHI